MSKPYTIPRKNALEWNVFAVSLLLVGGVVGYLVVRSFQEHNAPPHLSVFLGTPQVHNGRYALPVRVHNAGNQTAAQVEIVVTSGSERTTLTLQYVPRHSAREGTAFFDAYPAAPTGRVQSYAAP